MTSQLVAWAALGLFFAGMRLLAAHLQQLGNGPLRRALVRALNRPLLPHVFGFASGAVTQSTSAVTFIAAGLVSAGVLDLAAAVPLLAWANVGTSALVLVASLDVHAVVYILLGIIGVAFLAGYDQHDRYRNLVLALLGLGLLLLGLALLKDSAAGLRGSPWTVEVMEFAGTEVIVGCLIGLVLATAVQSSAIVAVLSLPLVHEGLLSLDQVSTMIYGASVGSGIAVMLVAAGLAGPGGQLALVQASLRVLAASLLLPLLLIEVDGGVPLVLATVRHLTSDPGLQCGLVYLAFQLGVVLVGTLVGPQLAARAERWSPVAAADALLKPRFIFDEAISDPETALSLANLEYRRLLDALPDYVEDLRPESERPPGRSPLPRRMEGDAAVATQLERFLSSVLHANPDMEGIDRVFEARSRLEALRLLHSALIEFGTQLGSVAAQDRPEIAGHMVEGLHVLLGLAGESVEDLGMRETVAALTEERSELMNQVRRALIGGSTGLAGHEAMVSATLTFERTLWMLRRLLVVDVPTATS